MIEKSLLFVSALVVGFAMGFLIGGKTRDELPGYTNADFSGGVLTVRVDAAGALQQGVVGVFK